MRGFVATATLGYVFISLAVQAAPNALPNDMQVVHMTTEHFHPLSVEQVGRHPSETEFKLLNVFDADLHVQLQKNLNLFAPGYTVEARTYDSNGNRVDDGSRVEGVSIKDHCWYHGTVKDEPEAWVAADSCSGRDFKATISHPTIGMVSVEPAHKHLDAEQLAHHTVKLQSKHGAEVQPHTLHVVKTLSVEDHGEARGCGVNPAREEVFKQQWASEHPNPIHAHEAHKSHVLMKSARESVADLISGNSRHSEHKAHTMARPVFDNYVELLAVSDKKFFQRIQQDNPGATANEVKQLTAEHAASLVNIVQQYYQPASMVDTFAQTVLIQLVNQIVVAPETEADFNTGNFSDPWPWALGPNSPCSACASPTCGSACRAWEISVDQLLSDFHEWRRSPGETPAHDNGQLFSGHDFEGGVLGYAGVRAMCSNSFSGGINMVKSPVTTQVAYDANSALEPVADAASVIAHEMGHNFGMLHDNPTSNPNCPSSGFIMNAFVSNPAPQEWSECSFDYYDTYINQYTCLDDVPSRSWGAAVCGNGFVEDGEDCDCGEADCAGTLDPCCDGSSCLFLASSECSNSSPCCESCRIVTAGAQKTCRAPASLCDIGETCDGQSQDCPLDKVKGAGTFCADGAKEGLCFDGECKTYDSNCLEVGQNFNGGPFSECPEDSRQGDTCGSLQCKGANGQCVTFPSPFPDKPSEVAATGVPCGSGQQCNEGDCVASSELNRKIVWREGLWGSCSSCDDLQYKEVFCVAQLDGLLTTPENNEVCSPVSKPDTVRPCINTTLKCVHGVNDNDLDLWARDIAERFNALDKAEKLRDLIPRGGYPTEFDVDDDDYVRGIQVQCLWGVFLCIGVIVGWIAFCILRGQNKCGGKLPNPNGYTMMQRFGCWGLLCAFLLVSLVFTALGLFWNGELRRGLNDDQIGASKLMNDLVTDVVDLTNLLIEPTLYLNESALPVARQAVIDLGPVNNLPADGETALTSEVTALRVEFDTLASLTVEHQEPTGTDVTFTCAACATASASATAVLGDLTGSVQTNIARVSTTVSTAFDGMTDLQQSLESDLTALNDDAVRILEVKKSAEDNEDTVQDYSDKAEFWDKIRHPVTAVLLVTPFVLLIFVILGGTCCKHHPVTFHATFLTSNVTMIAMFILLAMHMPLGLIMGDSCKYMNEAEADLSGTLNITVEAAAILQACLNVPPTTLVAALNLTDTLSFSDSVTFPAQGVIGLTQLDVDNLVNETQDIVAAGTSGVSGYDNTYIPTKLGEFNAATMGTYTDTRDPMDPNNVRNFPDGGASAANIRRKYDLIAYMDAEFAMLNALQEMDNLQGDISSINSALRTSYADALSVLGDVETDVQPSINAATTLKEQGTCAAQGDDYRQFKESWCDVMTTAVSFLALSFFMIGVLLIPVSVITVKLEKRMPNPYNEDEVEMQNVKGHGKGVAVSRQPNDY